MTTSFDPDSREHAEAVAGASTGEGRAPHHGTALRHVGSPDFAEINLAAVDVDAAIDAGAENVARWHEYVEPVAWAQHRFKVTVPEVDDGAVPLAAALRAAAAVGSVFVADEGLESAPEWRWPLRLGSEEHRVDATPDRSLANGSSIAFVLEVGSRKVLLAGDAHADVLAASIDEYIVAPKKLQLQAFKLPHHGSLANLDSELLDRIECKNFLVSTNGSYFGHPDKICMQLIVDNADDAHLWFNYATEFNGAWMDDRGEPYTAHYPRGITFR